MAIQGSKHAESMAKDVSCRQKPIPIQHDKFRLGRILTTLHHRNEGLPTERSSRNNSQRKSEILEAPRGPLFPLCCAVSPNFQVFDLHVFLGILMNCIVLVHFLEVLGGCQFIV